MLRAMEIKFTKGNGFPTSSLYHKTPFEWCGSLSLSELRVLEEHVRVSGEW